MITGPQDEQDWNPEDAAVRAAAGDSEAFGALYERYNAYVKRTARRVVSRPEDAEDIAQTVWSKLLTQLGHYSPEARFTTWLHRVVTHAAIDHTRKNRRERQVFVEPGAEQSEDFDHGHGVRAVPVDQELEYLQRRIASELESALARLRARGAARAVCFELHYGRELSVREIADKTGIAEGTVKSHLYYCRREIAESHPLLEDLYQALQAKIGRPHGG
jgi:RNA polymerase sigma-70 factor (ECF subfamily)